MRTIKFRAWDKKNKVMRQVWAMDSMFGEFSDHCNIHTKITAHLPGYFSSKETDPMWKLRPDAVYEYSRPDVELMQFTGLHDKNGEEIYEGDILKMDSWNPANVQVAFIEGAFCLANKAGHYIGDIHYIQHADTPQSSVIGNTYESPELLNK